MSDWTRRLVLPAALGLDLEYRRLAPDRDLDSWLGERFDEYASALTTLQAEAVAKGLEACRRAARGRDGGWFRKIKVVRDPVVRPVMDQVEEWLEPTTPEQARVLADELESLETAFASDRSLLGDVTSALREMVRLPDEGAGATERAEALYVSCGEALERWMLAHVPPEASVLKPTTRVVVQRAILAAAGRLASVHTSLRPIDVRSNEEWYAGVEQLLIRLRGDLGQAVEGFAQAAADEEPELAPTAIAVGALVSRLRWARGLAGALSELAELKEEEGADQRADNLAVLIRDLEERIDELRVLDRERSKPRPTTVRVVREEPSEAVPKIQPPAPPEEGRPTWRVVYEHVWDACVVFGNKAAFSMAASFALSSIFVVLTTLGFFEILAKAVSNTAQVEKLVFTTMLPQCLGPQDVVGTDANSDATSTNTGADSEGSGSAAPVDIGRDRGGLLSRSKELEARISTGGLYVVLGVLFLYFTISLQVSLAGNLNFLFDIETTHSFFDLRYVFGVFARGYFLRLAVVGVGVALALGGYAFLIQKSGILAHPLVGSVFAIFLVAYLVVFGLPLDDVPGRDKAVFGILLGPLLPVYNAVFDYMFYNFQSYKLMMQAAPVAMLTLWLYFGWVIVLFGLSLLQAYRNRQHVKRRWTRQAVVFEVLRLAGEELTFDQLLERIGTSRQQLREVIDALVARKQLEQYSPHIKVTAYVGDYHYRIPREGLSVAQLRLVLFPDQVDATAADVPVEVRKGVAEMVDVLEAAIAHQAQVDAGVAPSGPSTAWPIKAGSETGARDRQEQDSGVGAPS